MTTKELAMALKFMQEYKTIYVNPKNMLECTLSFHLTRFLNNANSVSIHPVHILYLYLNCNCRVRLLTFEESDLKQKIDKILELLQCDLNKRKYLLTLFQTGLRFFNFRLSVWPPQVFKSELLILAEMFQGDAKIQFKADIETFPEVYEDDTQVVKHKDLIKKLLGD